MSAGGPNSVAVSRQSARHVVALGLVLLSVTVAGAALGGVTAAESQSSPVEVSDWTDLDDIRNDTDADYVLVNDLNETTPGYDTVAGPNANGGEGFDPISGFSGSFDGQGNTIDGLTIDRPNKNDVGLFGDTWRDAVIEGVTLRSATVNGSGDVGGLVGDNGGTVNTSSASGAVTGSFSVGGLVGRNFNGTVSTSSASGAVTGSGIVGGLVGANYDGTVSTSSASGAVTGSYESVGGLVGQTTGTVRESFATGAVTGSSDVGGLVGKLGGGSLNPGEEAILTDSYYDTQTTEQQAAVGTIDKGDGNAELRGEVAGLLTSQMQGASAAQNMGTLDFTNTWRVVTDPVDYPKLGGDSGDGGSPAASGTVMIGGSSNSLGVEQSGTAVPSATVEAYNETELVASTTTDSSGEYTLDRLDSSEVSHLSVSVEGSVTIGGNPLYAGATKKLSGINTVNFVFSDTTDTTWTVNGTRISVIYGSQSGDAGNPIGNVQMLQSVSQYPNKGYELVRDIDASETESWNGGNGFAPIDPVSYFEGSLNGRGYTIDGLTIDRSGKNDVGLFGNIYDASIKRVILTNATVNGASYVGGLVAYNSFGTVSTSSVSGVVTGSTVGGLVGYNAGTVSNSLASATVTGGAEVGGLVGQNGGIVSNSSASGNVTGSSFGVGGLVGNNDGFDGKTVSESFATGAVTGGGGLVGSNSGTVTESYWDIQATGQSGSAGGTGLNTSQMQGAIAAQNMGALDFTNTWRVVTNPPGYPELQSLSALIDPEPPLTAGFSITPEDPTVGEQLTFDADPSTPESDIESYNWTLGDGTTATGKQVTHTYTNSGQFTVELTVQDGTETDTATKTVSVSPPSGTFGIESITPYVGGTAVEEYTHVEDLNTSLSYRVRVTQPSATANVTFELGGTTYTDTDGSDGWQFPVPTAQLASDETLLATAYGTDGASAVDSISVPVVETPAWFDLLDPISRFEDRPIIELQAEFPSGGGSPIQLPNQFPFAGDVSLPVVGSSQSSDLTATVTVRVNLRTAEATVTVGGGADYSLSNRVDLSGGVSGSASLNLYEMDIRGGTLDAEVGAEITFPGIPNPPIPPVPPGAVNLYPIFGIEAAAEAQFDEVDSVNGTNPVAFELTEGSITPELYARQELGQKLPVAELVFGIEEGVNTTIPYPSFEPINGSAFAEVYLRAAAAGLEASVSFPPGEDRFSYQFGPLGGDTVPAPNLTESSPRATTPTVEWQPVDQTGSAPPDRQLSATGAATARDGPTPVVAPDAVAGNRTTDNAVADKTPALAGLGSDESTLLWSQQQPNLSVLNGREILASTSTNGTSFGTPVALTNDTVSDYYPTITPTGGTTSEAVAAFTTFDRTFNESTVTNPGDIYPHGEIRVARLTETGWQSPTFLTNNTAFDFRPTVASHGDNWTIAWTRDGDGDLSTWSDRAVVYVRYNESGPVGPVRSVEQARSPRLTTVDGTTRLTYLDMASNATSGQLVIGSLQPGQSAPVEQASYSVSNLTDLTAANDTIVWTTTSGEPWAQVADTEGVRNLSAPTGLTPPQSVTLSSRPGRLLLNFRAARPDSSVAEAYYRPRVDGVWQSSRRYASGADTNLTYWQATTAGTESGFTSVVAGKELDTAQKDDLFVFRSQFRSDLAVTVQNRSENVTVGDEATLTVTVNNSGDIATDATTVAVNNSSDTVATASVPALQPGSSVERSLTATLDNSGQLRVTVDPNGTIQEHSEANNQETVRFQPPDLTVINRTVTRLNGTIRVNATLGNPSSITAPAVTYRIENGPTQNRSGSVGALAPGVTTQVSATFDASALSPRFPLTIRVDPTDSLTESNERNNTLVGPIREPEIAVSAEQITYGRQNGTIVATVPIENTGTGGGEGTLQITGAESETVIATQSFEVGPAVRTASSVVNSTQVALPGVTRNETVILNASARPQENGSSAVVDRVTTTDTVTPPPVASFNVTITNTTEPVEGQALAVTTQITNTGAANGTQSVTLDAGGLGANSTTVTLAGGATTTEVLTVTTGSGDAGTYTAQVASENDTASTGVRVDAPATFDVTLTSVDNEVTAGDSIGVTYEVTNTGDVQDTQNITFEVNETTEDTETGVILNGSETVSGQFSYDTVAGDAPVLNVTVASEDDSATETVTVDEPASFDVIITSVESEVTEGETITMAYEVTNTGDVADTQDIGFAVNGTTEDTASGVTLNGSETFSGQFTYTTVVGDAPAVSVAVSSADDSATETVTVNEPSSFDVTITSVDAAVTEGETITVAYQVQNTGDVVDTQDIGFAVNGTTEDTASSVTLNGSETFSGQFTYATAGGDAPAVSIAVLSADDSATQTVTVNEPANFDVTLTSVDSAVTEGKTITVAYEVTNTGDAQDTQDITFAVNGTTEDTESGVTLNGSETFSGQFTYQTVAGDAPAVNVAVSSADDSASSTVTVNEPASFDVTLTSVDSAVTEGETITVAYEVTNTGDQQGTQDITFAVNGTTEDTESGVTLNGSETFSGQFTYQTVADDTPTVTVAVSSADDSASEIVTVNNPASFDVTLTSIDSAVTESETITVAYEVTNTGGAQDTQDISFAVNGTTEDTESGVTLNGSETFSGQFSYTTDAGDAPAVSVAVSSADDSSSSTVTVNEPASFDVTLTSVDSAVTEGETVTLAYEVTNTGDTQDTQDITFAVNRTTEDSELGVTLSGNETFSGQFTYDTVAGDAPAVSVAVSSADDSDSNTVTVNEPSSVVVEIVETNTPVEGESLNVTATVENTGDVQDTQSIDLSVGPLGSDSTAVTLAGGASTNVTFSVSTGAGDAGGHTATVSSADDSASANVTVLAQSGFQVNIIETNTPIEGQQLNVTATIENTGDVEDTQMITLDVGPLGTDSTQVTLGGGASTNLTLSVGTDADDAGAYTATVASANDSGSANVTVLAPAELLVGIVETNTPVEGEQLNVTVIIENTGDVQDSQEVTLDVGPLGTDSTAVTLAGGASTNVTLSVGTGVDDAGEYTATVSSADDAASANVTVLAPAEFAVAVVETNTPVEGEQLNVTATVENTGDVQDTQTVTLDVGPPGSNSTAVTLGGGTSTNVTLSVGTGAGDAGEYTATVASADDAASANVTVLAPAEFVVSIVGTTTPVEGEQLNVTAQVRNTGDVQDTQSIELSVGALGTDSTTVTLGGGASTNVTLSVGTDAGDAGAYTATVSSAADSASANVTVLALAEFTVNIVETTSPVEGESLSVTANIQNSGDLEDTQEINLSVGPLGTDSTTVTLGGGASTDVTLSVGTGAGDAGAYTVTVASEDDTASANVTINEPSSFDVTIPSVDAAVTEGETITVAYEVTNIGDVADTRDITFAVNGTTEDTASSVTLNGSETVSGQFTYDTVAGDAPAVSVTVSSADDSASATVTVNEPPSFDMIITSVDSAVTEGETITVAYEVTNTGDVAGTQGITFAVNGTPESAESGVTLNGSETVSDQFSYDTVAGDAPAVTVTVSSEDNTASANVTVLAPAVFTVDIVETTTPVEGETLNVTAGIENTGAVTSTQTVTLDVGALGTDSTSVTLDGGGSTTLTLGVGTDTGDAGGYTATVSSANATTSANVTVLTPAQFVVSNLTAPAETTVGASITVSATVTNIGGADGPQTVAFRFDGQTVVNRTVSLAPNASTTLTFTPTVPNQTGTFEHGVFTDDDNETAQITVVEPGPPNVTLSNLRIAGHGDNATVLAGSYNVSVTVSHDGGPSGVVPVELTVGPTTVTENITLNASETTTVTFENATGDLSPGSYDVIVSAGNASVTGEVTLSVPVGDNPDPATDTDDDGLLEDVDGDGEFTIFDVQTLFVEFQSDPVQTNSGLFNFDGSGDGAVTIFDVQTLFLELAG